MPPVPPARTGLCAGSRCRWRPAALECSPRETCAAGRSNAAQRPSARDQWPWRSSTAGWRRWAVSEQHAPRPPGPLARAAHSPPTSASLRRWAVSEQHALADPGAAAASEFAELATGEQIATAAAALERNGIRPLLAATGAEARSLVGTLLR